MAQLAFDFPMSLPPVRVRAHGGSRNGYPFVRQYLASLLPRHAPPIHREITRVSVSTTGPKALGDLRERTWHAYLIMHDGTEALIGMQRTDGEYIHRWMVETERGWFKAHSWSQAKELADGAVPVRSSVLSQAMLPFVIRPVPLAAMIEWSNFSKVELWRTAMFLSGAEANARLGGVEMTPETKAIFEDCAEGRITADEMVERIKRIDGPIQPETLR